GRSASGLTSTSGATTWPARRRSWPASWRTSRWVWGAHHSLLSGLLTQCWARVANLSPVRRRGLWNPSGSAVFGEAPATACRPTMNRDALVTALAALAVAGCATTHVAGAPAPDPLAVATGLPVVAQPVTREPPPSPQVVPAPSGEPMTAALLRARLVAFVLQAEVTRGSVPMGGPMPEAQREAWRAVEVDVDRFLAGAPLGAEGEDVQIARGSLRAALDRDGQVYGGLPPALGGAGGGGLGQAGAPRG